MPTIEHSNRLLWNERSVIAFAAAALFTTVAILAWLARQRAGILDPESVTVFYRLFLFQDYWAAILFVPLLLMGLAPTVQRAGAALARAFGAHPWRVASAVFVGLAAGSYWVYLRHPLAMDEYAPFMQSKILLEGRLTGEVPPALLDWLIYPGFQDYFIHVSRVSGEIASAYWPSFALLLLPFTALGVPWLCNPVLGALSVLIAHRLAYSLIESREVAGTAVLFSIASAAFMINSVSYYSMTAHLLCNAAFALLLLQPTPLKAAFAGVVGGLALTLHNPVPHILFATPWLCWLLWRKDRWSLLPALAAGYLPWIIIVGFGWQYLLRSLHETTVVDNGLREITSGPKDVLANALHGIFALPSREIYFVRTIGLAKMWLWAVPALAFLAAVGFWRHRNAVHFRLLLMSAVLTLLGYLFVPVDQGHGWGFRYFHSAWFVLPIFAATAVGNSGSSRGSSEFRSALCEARYVQGVALLSGLILLPYFAWQVHSFVSAHLAQIPKTSTGTPRVIIINPALGYYAQDLVHNDPFLRDDMIYMNTQGRAKDAQMIQQYFPGLELLSKDYRGWVWGYPDK